MKILKNKRAEGYIDVCVGILVFVMVLVIFINVMSLVTLRQEMDVIGDNLIETATATGEFGEEFWKTDADMLSKYEHYEIDCDAEEFIQGNKVQLGKRMTVSIWVKTHVKGLGVFKIPITVRVEKYGLSEKYCK